MLKASSMSTWFDKFGVEWTWVIFNSTEHLRDELHYWLGPVLLIWKVPDLTNGLTQIPTATLQHVAKCLPKKSGCYYNNKERLNQNMIKKHLPKIIISNMEQANL